MAPSVGVAIDLLRDAVSLGTARAAAIPGLVVAAKTGTTSEQRDAWFAGHAGGLVTVVCVGRDDGRPLGLTGSEAAAPPWRELMRRGVSLRPPRHLRGCGASPLQDIHLGHPQGPRSTRAAAH